MTCCYPHRIALGQFPTTLERLVRLGEVLGGPDVWVKRDDQTGLATGGNKTRKLEFVVADALARRAGHLITLGGPQSNHCRQTAAAAARYGLGCSLVLGGHAPDVRLGNLLLDALFGAEIVFAGSRARETVAEELLISKRAEGANPHLVPLGASTGMGAVGYVAAMEELLGQCADQGLSFDTIVVASSSAGTQAGLVLGALLHGFGGRILGVSIDAERADLERRVLTLANDAAEILGCKIAIDPASIIVNADYLGGGYAVVGALERDAILTTARSEGLLLDPVYTGRAMGALIDLVRRGTICASEKVLFWHTGGSAALSAFADAFGLELGDQGVLQSSVDRAQ